MTVCTEAPTHPQVPFTTRRGVVTEVDAGLYSILSDLRTLGIETEWSCQGDFTGAYICAKAKGFAQLLRKARRLRQKGILSLESALTLQSFETGIRELKMSWYRGRGIENDPMYTHLDFFYMRPPEDMMSEYICALEGTNRYGLRVTLRWPPYDTESVEQLFCELSRAKQGL